jgi:hypothetical protein
MAAGYSLPHLGVGTPRPWAPGTRCIRVIPCRTTKTQIRQEGKGHISKRPKNQECHGPSGLPVPPRTTAGQAENHPRASFPALARTRRRDGAERNSPEEFQISQVSILCRRRAVKRHCGRRQSCSVDEPEHAAVGKRGSSTTTPPFIQPLAGLLTVRPSSDDTTTAADHRLGPPPSPHANSAVI